LRIPLTISTLINYEFKNIFYRIEGAESMNKRLLYGGICLLIVSLTCLIYGEIFLKEVTYEEIGKVEYDWKLGCTLYSGKTYLLYIESGDKWGEPFRQGLTEDPQPVFINVTLPSNNFAIIQALFYGLQPSSSWYQEVNLAVVDVKYVIKNPDLEVDEGTSQIRFAVKKNGNYAFNIIRSGIAETPPNYMALYEEVTANLDLYRSLILSGGLMCILSILIILAGIVKKERFKREKRKRNLAIAYKTT
jgi:hypothetical protein